MSRFRSAHGEPLSPALALSHPEAFKTGALEALGHYSVYGAALWNRNIEQGTISPERIEIDPSTWVSHSRASGDLIIGAQPMPAHTKEGVMFHAERFDYAKEIGYRTLHEAMHGFVYTTQGTPGMQLLLTATTGVRNATGGRLGLSALGSLDYYQGDKKVIEDTVELVTMYGWSPEYLAEFAAFLADPRHAGTRQAVGLATMAEPTVLYGLVEGAVQENL